MNEQRFEIEASPLNLTQVYKGCTYSKVYRELSDEYSTCRIWEFPERVTCVVKHPQLDYFFVGMQNNKLNVCGPGC